MDENAKTSNASGEDLKQIRTYESDVASAIQKDNTSMSTIVLAEKSRQRKNGMDPFGQPEPSGLKNKMVFILSGLFILGGAGIIFYLYQYGFHVPTPFVQNTHKDLITTDIQKNISVTGLTHTKLLKILTDERDKDSVALSSILELVLEDGGGTTTKKEISTTKLFSVLAPSAPSPLVRSFDQNFTLGVHAFGGNQLFLLLKITSYDNAFPGMLAWETEMIKEVGSIFIVPKIQKKNSLETVVSSTTKEIAPPQKVEFEDAVIKNKDARVLRDEKGNIIFLYSFIDKENLLFTGSENTLAEIISRLRTARLVR